MLMLFTTPVGKLCLILTGKFYDMLGLKIRSGLQKSNQHDGKRMGFYRMPNIFKVSFRKSLPKVLGTTSKLRCVFIYPSSFPEYSYFRTPFPVNKVDN